MIDTDSFDIAQFGHIVVSVKNEPRHRQIRAFFRMFRVDEPFGRYAPMKIDPKSVEVCRLMISVMMLESIVIPYEKFFFCS